MHDLKSLRQRLVNAARAEFARRTVRDSLLTLGGSLTRLAMGLIVARLLARGLGPGSLGAFYVMSSAVVILVTVADAGLSQTGVRHIARLRAAAPEEVPAAIGAFLVLKVSIAAVVAAAVAAFSAPLAGATVDLPQGDLLLRLAALGLVPAALGGWASFVAQGLRRFGWVTASTIGTSAAGLTVFAALAALGRLTVAAGVLAGAFLPLAGFAWLLPVMRGQRVSFARFRAHAESLLRFGGWLWVSTLLASVIAQLDLLLVNRWAAAESVGYYALAGRIAQSADLLNQSNFVALLPMVSALAGASAQRTYAAATLRRTVPLAGLLLLGALLAPAPIVWYFGGEYAPSGPLLWILMLSVALDLVLTPVLMLAFALDLPRELAASNLVRLLVLAGASAWWMPALGPAGAAWARLTARAAGGAFMLAVIVRRQHSAPGA